MARSLEYKAFRRRYSYLRNTLSPSSIAPVAFDHGLLTRAEKKAALHPHYTDEERMDKLLEAIEKRILASPDAFRKFLDLLHEVDEVVARELSASYQGLSPASSPADTPVLPYSVPSYSHEQSSGRGYIAQATPSLVSSQTHHPPSIGLAHSGREVEPVQATQTPVSQAPNLQFPVKETRPPDNAPIRPVFGGQERVWFFADGSPGKLQTDGGELDVTAYKAFEVSKSRHWSIIPLSSGDVLIERGKGVVHSPYSMYRFPHGVAVIINNEQFDDENLKIREGTAVDEENLVQTFRYLCYDVKVYHNCTSGQILEVFKKVQERDHRNYDSFVCCILSHGDEGEVFGSDGKPIQLSEVTNLLKPRKCPSLAGKPKMFFIQACRGTIRDPVVRVVSDSGEKTRSRLVADGAKHEFYVPNEADFLFSYATPQGHTAFRDTESGSWYISELCHTLCRSATTLHLDDMLKDVHRNVNRCYVRETESRELCRQVGEVTHRLQNNIYFFLK